MNDGAFFIPTQDAADDVLIFPIGTFWRDGVQREFTPEDAALMVAAFETDILERLPPINKEHVREAGKIGTISALRVADDGVRGDTDADLTGFDFLSPEVKWEWIHPFDGTKHKNVLMGVGATNYPFFLNKMALNNDAALLWTGSEWHTTQTDKVIEEQDIMTKEVKKEKQEETPAETPKVTLGNEIAAAMMQERIHEKGTEDYAAQIAKLETQNEQFTAQLAERDKANAELAEKFAASEKTRRLMHFTDTVCTFAVASEPESFAEDLWQIEQASAELVERVIERFRAASEAVKQGALFEQTSGATPKLESGGVPFLQAVEAKRQELFAELPMAEGYVKAEMLVAQEKPELALEYSRMTRHQNYGTDEKEQ